MVHRGASSLLEKHDVDWKKVSQVDWVHQTNSSGQLPLLKELFAVADKSETGISWNPGKADIRLLISSKLDVKDLKVDILLVNQEEWQMMKSVQPALKQEIREIVITNGDKGGVVLLDGQEAHKFSVKRVEPLDETGAGDAYGVGYVSAHLRGGSLADKCQLGCQNSASVVKHIGAKAGLLKNA